MKTRVAFVLSITLAIIRPPLSAQSCAITTIAGGTRGNADGPVSEARFGSTNLNGVGADSSGNLYICDPANFSIRKITPAGLVTTFARMPPAVGAYAGGGRLSIPTGLAVGRGDQVYVATYDHLILQITPEGVLTTLAGTSARNPDLPATSLGSGLFAPDPSNAGYVDGPASTARFSSPVGVAVDNLGNVYVAEQTNRAIRKITPAGAVTTLAGGTNFYNPANFGDGVGRSAFFAVPSGIATDRSGNVYVVDHGLSTIRKVTSTGVVTTIAGKPDAFGHNQGSADGTSSAASFNLPTGVAVNGSGDVYITDTYNGTIRKISPGGAVTTIAGRAGTTAHADGTGSVARFEFPDGITFDPAGFFYVTDGNFIRKGAPVVAPLITTQPRSIAIASNSTAVFSVSADDASATYQWKRSGIVLSGATGSTLVVNNVQSTNAGIYTCDVTNAFGTTTTAGATLAVGLPSNSARLINLAIRSNAGTGAQTLIVGLTISGGSAGATKPLLVRGIGPALTAFGVTGALADPALNLFQSSTAISSNDNWGGDLSLTNVFTSVGAFALTAPSSKDAALYNPVTPAGSFTVQLTGNGGMTGIALAEIYDATPAGTFTAATPRLTNVSARTQVGTGGDILIAGFSIGGATAKTVLIRAAGPALTAFGVAGVLADPKLELYSGPTLIATNDNWGSASAQTIADTAASVGAFSFGTSSSNDAALLITLPPGSYTAQVSGVGATSGVALVEIYELP